MVDQNPNHEVMKMGNFDRPQKKLKKTTMRADIRSYIHQQILSGALKPGDRIVETQLARDLNVSQAPVREAILELSVMGLLEDRPYSGTYVCLFTAEEIEDIYNTRAFIEEYAAARAAKRITPEEIERIYEVLEEMRVAAEEGDYTSFSVIDKRFHELILDAARSKAMKRIWNTLLMAEWTALSLKTTKLSLPDILCEHREIMRHIENRSEHSASAQMFLHIRKYSAGAVEYFTKRTEEINEMQMNGH